MLNIATIGGTYSNLYALSATATVKAPVCYYQKYQPNSSTYVTVAGGSWYKNGVSNINSDWTAVVNYVKSHACDDKGSLQIGYRGVTLSGNSGGHAINFLRYAEVGGEQRIYAYDNNFPNNETYFYKDAQGKIRQMPNDQFRCHHSAERNPYRACSIFSKRCCNCRADNCEHHKSSHHNHHHDPGNYHYHNKGTNHNPGNNHYHNPGNNHYHDQNNNHNNVKSDEPESFFQYRLFWDF